MNGATTIEAPSGDWGAKAVLNRVGPLLALAVVYGLFVLIGPESFREARTLETIARQTTVVGIAALGMTVVMIAGAIDLSVGSIVAISSVVIAMLLRDAEASPLVAALCGVAAGAAAGFITGMIVTTFRVVPFIVTLGMMMALRGVATGLADKTKVYAPETWLQHLLVTLPAGMKWLLVAPGVWVLAVLAVLVGVLLRYTRFGRHVFAVGSNEATARLCGLAVGRIKVLVFALGGAFAGLAGLMQFSRISAGDPRVAIGLELDVIAAVVIGGGSLSGGEGSVLGTLVGALIMGVISSGCSHIGWDNWVQEIITGGIIVVAVALDRLRHRRTAG
ncbi:MAG: ABC transporter permease [Planctomycetaceae bacterium]|nr:ABC transporter permease [Planctomycetaceae bacterium]